MGLLSSLKIAKRALTRRKTKNLSAILAITLGVTLMVGIQITTATLENAFLTSLLIREGETDIRVTNGTGSYLTAADEENISSLVPDAIGIMPELKASGPAMVGSQFEPSISMAGIPLDFPSVFGDFYDWITGDIMDISDYLVDNSSVLLSSRIADNMGLNKTVEFPITLRTEFSNLSLVMRVNETTGAPIINETTMLPIFDPFFKVDRVNLTVKGIFDSSHPGIGASYRGLVFSLESFQQWQSLQTLPRNTDIIGAYLIAFQTDHFNNAIDEDILQAHFDSFEENIPLKMINGNEVTVYTADSSRLLYFGIIDTIFNLMSSFLNVLGMLIIITGILLITNVQLMSVEDREFQTGVLRAVGEKRRGVFQSMFFETIVQGVFGGIFGLSGRCVVSHSIVWFWIKKCYTNC
jgi:ABC-type antimicrobial peptide transport system permease subunit